MDQCYRNLEEEKVHFTCHVKKNSNLFAFCIHFGQQEHPTQSTCKFQSVHTENYYYINGANISNVIRNWIGWFLVSDPYANCSFVLTQIQQGKNWRKNSKKLSVCFYMCNIQKLWNFYAIVWIWHLTFWGITYYIHNIFLTSRNDA